MNELTIADAVLAAGLLVACATDLRDQKIPNALTFGLIGLGIVIHFVQGNYWFPIVGVLAAFGLHFALFALQVEKPGDGKLMMGVGALLGWSVMLEGTLWKFLINAPVGLIVLWWHGRLGNFLKRLQYVYRKALRYPVEPPQEELTYMPFAPSIAIAVVLARFTDLLYLWGD